MSIGQSVEPRATHELPLNEAARSVDIFVDLTLVTVQPDFSTIWITLPISRIDTNPTALWGEGRAVERQEKRMATSSSSEA